MLASARPGDATIIGDDNAKLAGDAKLDLAMLAERERWSAHNMAYLDHKKHYLRELTNRMAYFVNMLRGFTLSQNSPRFQWYFQCTCDRLIFTSQF